MKKRNSSSLHHFILWTRERREGWGEKSDFCVLWPGKRIKAVSLCGETQATPKPSLIRPFGKSDQSTLQTEFKQPCFLLKRFVYFQFLCTRLSYKNRYKKRRITILKLVNKMHLRKRYFRRILPF